MIIGISGKKRHGKNSIGDILERDWDFIPIAFADPIKKIAMDVYGLTYEQCWGDLKEVEDPRWGKSPRFIMQHLGTEMAREIHPETWIRYAFRTIERAQRGEEIEYIDHTKKDWNVASHLEGRDWCITDCRFPNEAEAIRSRGGMIWKVVRPSLEGKNEDSHASETNIDLIEPDVLFTNNGTLQDLAIAVHTAAWRHDQIRKSPKPVEINLEPDPS